MHDFEEENKEVYQVGGIISLFFHFSYSIIDAIKKYDITYETAPKKNGFKKRKKY
jgi:hypothetical protein